MNPKTTKQSCSNRFGICPKFVNYFTFAFTFVAHKIVNVIHFALTIWFDSKHLILTFVFSLTLESDANSVNKKYWFRWIHKCRTRTIHHYSKKKIFDLFTLRFVWSRKRAQHSHSYLFSCLFDVNEKMLWTSERINDRMMFDLICMHTLLNARNV